MLQIPTNSTTLTLVGGGNIVKQGDTASKMTYRLGYAQGNTAPSTIDGQSATIALTRNGSARYTATANVATDTVTFAIDKALPAGEYAVTVSLLGQLYPSDNEVTIIVTQGVGDLKEIDLVPADIASLRAEIEALKSNAGSGSSTDTETIAQLTQTIASQGQLIQELKAKLDGLTVSGDGTASVDLSAYMTIDTAYSTFPTFSGLYDQVTNLIKTQHLGLGLDALIDQKLANDGDAYITTSQATDLLSRN